MDKPTLLVVDDDEAIRTQLKYALREDFTLFLAEDRRAALSALEAQRPQLVSLDLGLPPAPDSAEEGLRTLEEILAKALGAVELDLGRSDTDNTGLIAFKEHLGATRHPLTYWRAPETAVGGRDGTALRMGRRLFAMLPGPLRRAAGSLLYPHLA